MTPEERKSYNEKYYKENKTKILIGFRFIVLLFDT